MSEDDLLVKSTLKDREELIREKTIVLEKLLKEKKDILKDFTPGKAGFNREGWSKRYDQNLEDIQKLTKDLADELRELASFKRGKRIEEWPAWWNLWIGGFIAALVVDFFDWLWEMIQVLLRNLNNPEKVLEIAKKVLDAIGGL